MKTDRKQRITIIGAGMGGIAAAIALSSRGHAVEVFEQAGAPGGKMRKVEAGGASFDAGPTVLTMKWVFDELLARCGTRLEDEIGLSRADLLARHYWQGGAALDLFCDAERSAAAIDAFAGPANADGYRRFARDSERVFSVLQRSYIDAPRPNPISLSWRVGPMRFGDLMALKPFSTLWRALRGYFPDPRLCQLFGRYATYCGSSPFASPATLMLVAHVERDGVWLVDGGMHALARQLTAVAGRLGAIFHFGEGVRSIEAGRDRGTVRGITTEAGRFIEADKVIFNGDVAMLDTLLAKTAAPDRSRATLRRRSLSAMVACSLERPAGVDLAHHTVFFSGDYEREFDALFARREPPDDPTVYVCAQDRDDAGRLRHARADGRERIYTLINMPADGDASGHDEKEVERCMQAMRQRLERNGLRLEAGGSDQTISGPETFNRLFPGSGGALYGMASHGWAASFSRMGSRSPLRGLYLAGGSVHPGPGVPMAALSGKLAAEQLISDTALSAR